MVEKTTETDTNLVLIDELDDFSNHAIQVVETSRREVLLLSKTLDPAIYNNEPFYQAVLDFARQDRNAQVKILVKDIQPVVEQGHRILNLARRLWNKIFNTVELFDYTFGCDIHITTTRLSQFSYDEDYDFREKLVYKMNQDGFSNKDISDYLNEHKIQPKRTEKYTTKLVWSILKKYRLKLERQKHVEVRYENIGLYKRVV